MNTANRTNGAYGAYGAAVGLAGCPLTGLYPPG
jgi:hypothetical protein